jgi:Skp family chaperone for outer membrane proteins
MFNNVIKKAVKEAIETITREANNKYADILRGVTKLEVIEKQLRDAKDELADVKKEKELEMQEFEHLVKLKEERQKLALETERVKLSGEYQKKEGELQKEYFDKTLKNIEKASYDIKDVYKQILERLPNVNVKMTGQV